MSSYMLKKLGDVFSSQFSGEWGNEPLDIVSGVNVLRTTNFTNSGAINYEDVIKRDIDKKKIKEKRLDYGDIIIEKSGGSDNQPVGRVVFYDKRDETFLCNNFTSVLRTDNNFANSKYVFYFMFYQHQSGRTKFLQNKTTGIRNLQLKRYMDISIPLPPINVQKKIIDILDKAKNLIDLRKKQIEQMDLLIKSKFIEMFGDPVTNPKGWEKTTYGEICRQITDGEHITPKREKNGIYLLSARNIMNHKLQLDQVDFIGESEFIRISRRLEPEKNDILISCSGSVGRVCRVPANFKAQLVRSVAILKLKENINAIFMEYLIDSDFTQRQINQSVNQSSQANLFQNKIKIMVAIVPPISTQIQFACFVESVEKQKYLLQQGLDKMEINYKSLMEEYFG